MNSHPDHHRAEYRRLILETFPRPFALGVAVGLALLGAVFALLRLSGAA